MASSGIVSLAVGVVLGFAGGYELGKYDTFEVFRIAVSAQHLLDASIPDPTEDPTPDLQ